MKIDINKFRHPNKYIYDAAVLGSLAETQVDQKMYVTRLGYQDTVEELQKDVLKLLQEVKEYGYPIETMTEQENNILEKIGDCAATLSILISKLLDRKGGL